MRFRDLFKVETLDTRFQPQSIQPLPGAQPSKWNTPEFYLYYAFFLTIPFLMFKSVYDVSQPSHPHYAKLEPLLEPGWIPGRKVDNSDAQYRGFRDNVPYMAVVLALHPLLRRAYERSSRDTGPMPVGVHGSVSGKESSTGLSQVAGDARLSKRIAFDLFFACIFLLALHGISAFKVLLIIGINYRIATKLPQPYVGTITWLFNVGILFANELCRGYSFATVFSFVLPPQSTNLGSTKGGPFGTQDWGAWLDSYGGLIPRWEVLFNFTVLRLIAFNFDYIWMQERREGSPVEVHTCKIRFLPD